MKTKYFLLLFSLISLLILSACKNPFRYTDAREIPVDGEERVRKNIEEGRGITIFSDKPSGGVFDFASSNELWRASIEVLDFVSFTNASYSGGILITDWFSGNTESNENNQREIKITVRFLSNEIRSDSVKIIVHNKKCKTNENCSVNEIDSNIKLELQKSILAKAAQFEKASKKSKK